MVWTFALHSDALRLSLCVRAGGRSRRRVRTQVECADLELSATIHLRGAPDLTGFSAHAGEVNLLSVGKGGRLTMSISISGLDPFASYYLRLYRDGAQLFLFVFLFLLPEALP